ncbi:divalent-cation tolerance protein CutA [Candidatus Saccharibacteria bacterium]|nr:divalent-cation tolerance protein CutA [Candidatus Saccharibacteria bacterium]
MSRQYVELLLSCENEAEASKIAEALLAQHLIVCVKRLPIESTFWWKDGITLGHEVLMLMESALDLFDAIEIEVEKLHSYETFVLQAMPFVKISKSATAWVENNLRPINESSR